ncbi:MAG: helix-turn-helix transcriptional regulator [Clostridia bacterium]|nr:helix-turn-helix transcriptional regulator [Clostridia bacterium]
MNFRLKSLREEAELTQQELAEKLSCAQQTITSYESERTQPDIETLCKMAAIFDTSVDYLIGYSDVRRSFSYADESELVDREKVLLKSFCRIPDEMKDCIIGIIESYLKK